MITSIINNSSNVIQVYLDCTDSLKTPQNLESQVVSKLTFIGPGSSSDAPFLDCSEDAPYISISLWPETAKAGAPDSWLIYDPQKMTIIGEQSNKYKGKISGQTLTVTDGAGTEIIPTQQPKSNLWLYILLTVLVLVVFGGLGIGLFIFLRKRRRRAPIIIH